MAPFLHLLSVALLAATSLPTGLAGPACKTSGRCPARCRGPRTSALSTSLPTNAIPKPSGRTLIVSRTSITIELPTAPPQAPAPPPPPPAPQPQPQPEPKPEPKPDPQPSPAPPPPAPPAPAPSSGGDIDQYLASHNNFRAQHGAAPLTWSNDLASKAQQWANNCQFKHSGGTLGPFGENLAAGTGGFSIQDAIGAWNAEVSEYDPANPVFSHFTQVVWKSTTQLGCAVQSCDGIFSGFGKAQFYVCEYFPAGNVVGQFAENVQK